MISRKLSIDQESQICIRYSHGETARELSKQFKCSEWLVLATLRRNKFTARRTGPIEVSEATRRVIGSASRALWKNEEYRKRRLPQLRSIGFKRDGRKDHGYTRTVYYKNFRKMLIEERGSKCQLCLKSKLLDIHHIDPVKLRPDLIYNKSNIEILCRSCHIRKDALRRRSE